MRSELLTSTLHALYLHFNKAVSHELADWNAVESKRLFDGAFRCS